jgi:oxygen-independent coproporphyrinogen III oxidase
MPLGIYISVPFCKSKCSYCNFASGVASRATFARYVDRVCEDIARSESTAHEMGGAFERRVDSVYLGGGTPTLLTPEDFQRLFRGLRQRFELDPRAEITVECAPGTLTLEMIETLARCGVNRVSLGVQSWVDQEAAAVGRLHTRAKTLEEIARLRATGITNINIDLIAGLPHQTEGSWRYSLDETIASGAPHVSVYMLEVDEDSRLGRELIAGGTKYHAHFVPEEDQSADFYSAACERLEQAGIHQYEISNFARPGAESRHNLKYWERQPYLGFGVDAHSMLWAGGGAVRFATPDDPGAYTRGTVLTRTPVDEHAAFEEIFFLGLRLTRGVNLRDLETLFGEKALASARETITELCQAGLIEAHDQQVRLTPKGRLLSNEVFQRFLVTTKPA